MRWVANAAVEVLDAVSSQPPPPLLRDRLRALFTPKSELASTDRLLRRGGLVGVSDGSPVISGCSRGVAATVFIVALADVTEFARSGTTTSIML